eukprot:COSAG03_NODE_8018_length_845_cov_0.902145_2_plen_92_part_01
MAARVGPLHVGAMAAPRPRASLVQWLLRWQCSACGRGQHRTVCIVVRCYQLLWLKRQSQPSSTHGAVGALRVRRRQSLCRRALLARSSTGLY